MAELIVLLLAALWCAWFYFPVYLPLVLGLTLSYRRFPELKLAFLYAFIAGMLLLFFRPDQPRPDFGDDVAGAIAGSEYYFAHEFWPGLAWTWITGLSCTALACVGGVAWRRVRRSRHA